MDDNRLGGAALIVGSLSSLLVMLHHPTGHELLGAGSEGAAHRNVLVHGVALAAMPLMLLGALALTRRLQAPDRLAVMGFVTYAFATAAVMCAAVMSGLVAPRAIAEILRNGETDGGSWHVMLRYTGWLNRGFAQVFVVASAVAIVCWALAILRGPGLPVWTGWFAVVVGIAVLALAFSGHLWQGMHGFGFVVLAEGAWFVAVGFLLCMTTPPAAGVA